MLKITDVFNNTYNININITKEEAMDIIEQGKMLDVGNNTLINTNYIVYIGGFNDSTKYKL